MLPPQLAAELDELKQRYKVETVEEESVIDAIIRDFPTSALYKKPATNLLLRVPRSYPDAGLDMFWTDPDLLLLDGSEPTNAQQMERYPALDSIPEFNGKQWRRFSWHPQPNSPRRWNPSVDNIESYLQFVRKRFGAR
jgi:hypothetical protein